MIKRIIFAGGYTAETIGPFEDWAVISIGEPDVTKPNIRAGWHDVLPLSFHDVDPDKPIESQSEYTLMATSDAVEIVEYVRKVAPNVDAILVHCKAGISRSAAVAKWIAEQYELPFDHDYPHINRFVYRLLQEANAKAN